MILMTKRGALYGLLGLALAAGSCRHGGREGSGRAESDSFRISGRLSGLGSGWMVLSHQLGSGEVIVDSVRAEADTFRFVGNQPSVSMYELRVPGAPGSGLRLFLGNETVTLSGNRDSVALASVKGAAAEGVYRQYEVLMAPLESQRDSLNQAYLSVYGTDGGKLAAWDSAAGRLDSLEADAVTGFVKAHPSSVVSAWVLRERYRMVDESGPLLGLYGLLKGPALKSDYGRQIHQELETARTMVPGKPAPGFSLPDTAGREVTLKSLKGSYVLIHFWASWYGPGRRGNLAMTRALHAYRSHGLRVLGVSLDHDREAWLGAIRRDHLDWTQVSDLRGWNSAVALRYGVRSLPANVLVDPAGVIVDRDLMGRRLEATLKKLFE